MCPLIESLEIWKFELKLKLALSKVQVQAVTKYGAGFLIKWLCKVVCGWKSKSIEAFRKRTMQVYKVRTENMM